MDIIPIEPKCKPDCNCGGAGEIFSVPEKKYVPCKEEMYDEMEDIEE